MYVSWQAAGGLSYVASVHHCAPQCFVSFGNIFHEGNGDDVSLDDFKVAVRCRLAWVGPY